MMTTPNSCKPFANQPGVHEIKVPGLEAFEVLCTDSSIAGPGWIIIQQRINGQQDFHQDWQAYRDGFGLNKTSGDFFLGLQRIHRLTYSQRYELFIYMQTFRGGTFHIRYDNFTVGSENDKFELQSLGAVDMVNVEDQLRYHEHHKFTTHDQDNDNWWRNCATEIRSGGWWYHKSCTHCNLNGVYFKTETDAYQSIHWFDYKSLKMVQMLIRPIN
ncbi:ryncolin-1-like [Drosophila busckii]|uniref:ryncolin-1-like n=1 Tax=Drosophila busckii TaxID=30019 RepID=UPI00083E9D35|nr:ryncolin-1-like [Drosophila busckii]